jgi:hypothetical protein
LIDCEAKSGEAAEAIYLATSRAERIITICPEKEKKAAPMLHKGNWRGHVLGDFALLKILKKSPFGLYMKGRWIRHGASVSMG